MKIVEIKNGIMLEDIEHFDATHIFECGQCFRWEKEQDGSYTGIAFGKVLNVQSDFTEKTVVLKNTNIEDFHRIWFDYFDLGRDYGKIREALGKDTTLEAAAAYGAGIRILNQEPWETLISFIVSANNNIPRIMKILGTLSELFGESVQFEGKNYFTFPTAKTLGKSGLADIEFCRAGYRGKHILETVAMIDSGLADLDAIKKLDTESARKELLKLKGVGPKVADCILLFSMQKHDVYPVDVWVKRVTKYFYLDTPKNEKEISDRDIRQFARDKFGDLAGFAQQYLFYYARSLKIAKI